MATTKSVNPFDTIASTTPAEKKSKSNKIAAQVNDKVKEAVDSVIACKAKINTLKAEQVSSESIIIDHVYQQQKNHARSGNFSKSFSVSGNADNALTFTTSDAFSVPKDFESQEALKELLGQKLFNELFTYRRTITLKEEAQSDLKIIQKIQAALKTIGVELGDIFSVEDSLIALPGLDKKQFDLPDSKLETLRTIVSQKKPALK